MNTVRIRLWNIREGNSGWNEVKTFSEEVKSLGLKVWLTVHYSDTWADPGSQTKPDVWKNLSFNQLKDSVYSFTSNIITEINPDYIQIGNEINPGFLWPEGHISNKSQMIELLRRGIAAVRDHSDKTKIMLHYAGHEEAAAFFSDLQVLDFDIIALSYYPIWHGKDLLELQSNINHLGSQYNKDIVIAETSYPFSLGWNDWTHNVIGSEDQLLPQYPPSEQGQADFLYKILQISTSSPRGIGFSYWGAEWVAFKGSTATNGSSWENMALWDFNNKVLLGIKVFND
jgi:arabinogalactan endo-1,4-beta-galactosidase